MQDDSTENFSLAADRLVGVKAIAAFRGELERRTHYLLEQGLLPAGKEGQIYVASKRTLIEHHFRLTSGAEVREGR